MKTIAAVLASVVLSLSVVQAPKLYDKVQIQQLRQASWRLDLSFTNPYTGELVQGGFCSGTVVRPNLVLTAAHCDIKDEVPAPDLKLSIAGHPYTIVKKDVDKDLMLLYVSGLASPVASVGSVTPKQDAEAVVVGYPFGLTQFVTHGHIQAGGLKLPKEAEAELGHKLPSVLATEAGISPGNSGGGIFVKEGMNYKLVGVCSMGGGDVGLFVNLDTLKEFLS